MKKQLLQTSVLLLTSVMVFAQTPTVQAKPSNVNVPFNKPTFDSQIFLIDPNGQPLNREYTGLDGSPFLLNEFRLASVVLSSGKMIDSVSVRLDVQNQELHSLAGNTVYIISKGKVQEIKFFEPIPANGRLFKCGFPKIDNQDEYSFYAVLAEGKVSLLKSTRKIFVSAKNQLSGELENRFDMYEDYYVTSNNEMKRMKKDKDFILSQFPDKKEKIESYFKEKKPNLKVTEDLAALFNYCNTL